MTSHRSSILTPAATIDKATMGSAPTDVVEADTLHALGYDQSYRRVLKTVGTICMVISLTSPCLAILISSFYQITYGGFWGLTWGWTIASIIFFPQALAVAELVSAMPVNGCFYWWTAALAPRSMRRVLSFVAGWTNLLALATSVASFAFATASTIQQAIIMVTPEWEATNAQLMAIAFGFVFIWMTLAAFRLEDIAWIYLGGAAILFVHLMVYIIALPTTHAVQGRPWATGADVFGNFTNYSDWTTGVAVTFTFFTSVWTNSAWATPAYVVESTHNGRRSAAWGVVSSYLVTAGSGLVVCLLAAFCVENMDELAADPTGYPLFTMLQTHWGTRSTAAFLLVSVCVTGIGGSAQTLSYGSQIAAFARDGGVPFSSTLARVSQRVNMPVPAILTLGVASCLVLLFSLSAVAAQIIYSLSTISYLLTMGLPNWLRLFAGDKWVPGPINFGRWSKPIFLWAGLTQLYLAIMESFPPVRAWDASTLNYSWCLTLGVILFALVLYPSLGKNYTGPDFEALEHYRHDRVEGIAPVESVQAASQEEGEYVQVVQALKDPNLKT